MTESEESSGKRRDSLALTTGGITLLGVLLSTSVSVALGISGPWWVRLLSGLGTLIVLVAVVKVGSEAGHGPLARLARWVIGDRERP